MTDAEPTRAAPAATAPAATAPAATADGSFRIRLARSGGVLTVPPDLSILEVLRRHGLHVPSSCEAGICSSCQTGLLAGIADHRDYVLDADDQGSAIMVCVSRARSEELTLDV